jgi:hypothetical protein
LILVNAGSAELSAQLTLPSGFPNSAITRSVFSGVERSAQLGPLPAPAVLRLPPQAVVTVALSR